MADSEEFDDVDSIFEDTEISSDPSTSGETYIKEIIEIAERHSIKWKMEAVYFDEEKFLVIHMPNGRETRNIYCASESKIKSLIDINFEKYSFIGDYEAIFNREGGYIEAVIRPSIRYPTSALVRRILGKSVKKIPESIIKVEDKDEKNIEIGNASSAAQVICSSPRGLTLKITNIPITTHSEALEVLEKISNSFLFQLDLKTNIPVSLSRSRRGRRPARSTSNNENPDFQFPKYEFDKAPISLYWYARGAIGMPLLQFLAYYQVIEYYFPVYSQEEARKRVRATLKDPSFRVDKDVDISKLLSAASANSRGFGDERTQLRATINSCVDIVEIRDFFTQSDQFTSFFNNKQKGLTDFKIPLSAKDQDLRPATADLIYDIRCKIVHTKADTNLGEVDLLLPFSKEAELLYMDIELMHFIAKKVLISASVPLSL